MRFEQYQLLKQHALAVCEAAGAGLPDADRLNPVLLAYIGDAVFSLYVRLRLIPVSGQVRVIHELGAKMVSAVCQSRAMQALLGSLSEEELLVYKWGRNTKSTVPKSASVHEYRMATALEALIGWLFLKDRQERLQEVLDSSFCIITGMLENK